MLGILLGGGGQGVVLDHSVGREQGVGFGSGKNAERKTTWIGVICFFSGLCFHLIFKPTTEYKINGKVAVKGNVDAELVLYAAAKVYDRYDKAIIVSGDGDFMCLVEYLHEKGKMAHVIVPNAKYSKLLGNFQQYIFRLDRLKNTLEYKKDQRRRSVETLGVSGHGDTSSIVKRARKVNNRSGKK